MMFPDGFDAFWAPQTPILVSDHLDAVLENGDGEGGRGHGSEPKPEVLGVGWWVRVRVTELVYQIGFTTTF